MSNHNLSFQLEKREDKNGKTFFICKVKAPALIDLSKGATFFVFASEDGLEELQIAPFQEKERFEIDGKDESKSSTNQTKNNNSFVSPKKEVEVLYKK